MEYFQRLLGTLQQAVDFVSSFTAYLLGDEAHPGAGESENARETRNSSSHHNCEVETTHYGDVPPEGHLEVFEGPLTTEVSSPSWEIQERVETVSVNGVQFTEVIPELSEPPYKYEKESERKLSDSYQFLADAPQENLTTIVSGSNQKKELDGLLKWEPKRTSWNGAAHQKVQEKVIDTKWEPVKPLVGSKEHRDPSYARGATVGQENELQKTLLTQEAQEGAANGAHLLGEQQRGLAQAAWTGRFQHGELEETKKMADGQQLDTEAEENQQGEPKKGAVEEGILEATLGEAESDRNQEEVLEEEVGRSYQWESKGEVDEPGGITVGWGKELKETLRSKEVQQGAPDWTQLVEDQQKGPEEAMVWIGGFQHGVLEEVNKMAESQQLETAKEEEVEADEDQKWEPNSMAVEEGMQEVVVGVSETDGNQEEVLEEEEKMGTSHQCEPKGEAEEEGEMNRRQEKELEETLWNKVVLQGAPDWEQFVEEQVGLDRIASSMGFQCGELEGADKIAEWQCLEREKEHEEVEVAVEKEDVADMVGGKEGVQEGIPRGEESEEDEQKAQEEVERGSQWEPNKEVEEVGGTTVAPEMELEGIWRNKEVQQGTLDWNQLVTKQQRGLVKVVGWSGGLQHGVVEEVDKMVDGQQLGSAKEEVVKAEEDQQWEPNRVTVEEGIMECMLDKLETLRHQEEVLEEKEEVGRNNQWELKREVGEERGTNEKLGKDLEETLWNKEVHQRSPDWKRFVEEQQVGLQRTASSVAFQCGQLEEEDIRVKKQCLEVEKVHAEAVEVVEEWKGMVDTVEGKEGIQEPIPRGEDTEGDQQEDVEEEGEMERSHQWEPKEEIEDIGEPTVDQERELEGTWRIKEVQQGVPEQQELEKVAAWTEGLQCGLLDKMAEGQQLDIEQEEGEEVKAAEYQEQDPDRATGEGIQEGMLDKAEIEGDYKEEPRGNKYVRTDLWEPELAAVNFQDQYGEPKGIADNRKGQQGKMAGAEENEGDQQKEPVRNRAQTKGEEQEEHTGRALENEMGEESEKLTEAWCLDKEVQIKIKGDQLRQLEEKQKTLQHGSMVSHASFERGPLLGPSTFPVEVMPLDTSVQKERVVLRRKSSVRRAPSLKRSRASEENLAQETTMANPENTSPQPQPPSRPPPRHFGFGPMHPNMMAELQIRLRKPQ